MTVKHSRKLLNLLAGGMSLREIYADCLLDVYEGTAPTNPEDAATGTKLFRVSLASATVAQPASELLGLAATRAVPNVWEITVGSGSTEGNTVKVTVTVDSVETTYTYTILAADNSDAKVAAKVARMLNDIPEIQAIYYGTGAVIWAQCRIAGLAMTIANGGGTYAISPVSKVTAVATSCLQFGPPAAGVISKPTAATWTGLNLAGGTAGYFRVVTPSDPGILDTGYIHPRTQGTLATVGGDATIDPSTVTIGATSTVTSFTLTIPTSST